jgi:hypothetical protein
MDAELRAQNEKLEAFSEELKQQSEANLAEE